MLYMLLFALLYTNSMSQRTYKAVVVEYAPIRELKQLPRQVVERNAAEYVRLIEDAGVKGANIIIFPEYGLTTLEATTKVSDHLDSYSIEIPATEENITQNPCNNSKGNYSYHKLLMLTVSNYDSLFLQLPKLHRSVTLQNTSNLSKLHLSVESDPASFINVTATPIYSCYYFGSSTTRRKCPNQVETPINFPLNDRPVFQTTTNVTNEY